MQHHQFLKFAFQIRLCAAIRSSERRQYCRCNVLSTSVLFHLSEAYEETLYCCCNVLSALASGRDSDHQIYEEWQASEVVLYN